MHAGIRVYVSRTRAVPGGCTDLADLIHILGDEVDLALAVLYAALQRLLRTTWPRAF